jgi:hypothetical protein
VRKSLGWSAQTIGDDGEEEEGCAGEKAGVAELE